MPENGQIETLAEAIVNNLERTVSEQGWDRPALLFEVKALDAPTGSIDLDAPSDDLFISAYTVELVDELDGHPYHRLVGRTMTSDEVLAVAITTEAWDYPEAFKTELNRTHDLTAGVPDGVPPPSEHPDRVELRLSHILFRDGTQASILHYRDSPDALIELQPDPESGIELGGRLADALHRYLRIPTRGDITVDIDEFTARVIETLPLVLASADPKDVAALDVAGRDPNDPAVWKQLASMIALDPDYSIPALAAVTHIDGAADWDAVYAAVLSQLRMAQALHGAESSAGEVLSQLEWFDARMLANTLATSLPSADMLAETPRKLIREHPELEAVMAHITDAAAAFRRHAAAVAES